MSRSVKSHFGPATNNSSIDTPTEYPVNDSRSRTRAHHTRGHLTTLVHDYNIETVTEHVGRDFGVTRGVLVDQSPIDQFAECSRDDQWVHVDVERARKSPLGTTIAHGLLTLPLTTGARYELGVFPSDAGRVLNYGLDKVRFLAPVPRTPGSWSAWISPAPSKSSGRTLIRCRNTAYCEGKRPVRDGGRVALHADGLTGE